MEAPSAAAPDGPLAKLVSPSALAAALAPNAILVGPKGPTDVAGLKALEPLTIYKSANEVHAPAYGFVQTTVDHARPAAVLGAVACGGSCCRSAGGWQIELPPPRRCRRTAARAFNQLARHRGGPKHARVRPMHGSQTRRGFLGGMLTGGGAIALIGCVDQPEASTWTGIVDPEPVAAPAGLRYANVLPTRVPVVRQARPVLAH